jgi:hypothetical protein
MTAQASPATWTDVGTKFVSEDVMTAPNVKPPWELAGTASQSCARPRRSGRHGRDSFADPQADGER